MIHDYENSLDKIKDVSRHIMKPCKVKSRGYIMEYSAPDGIMYLDKHSL